MSNKKYEMPKQEFIRSTIESLVGTKLNEIPSEQLTQLVIKQEHQDVITDAPEHTKRHNHFIHIVPSVEVISGYQPSLIETDTILSLAYTLLDKLITDYERYHMEPPYAVLYMSHNKKNSSQLRLYPRSALNSLHYYKPKSSQEIQTKLYSYKLKAVTSAIH